MDIVEKCARAICKAENVDPDQEGVGMGCRMPEGEIYPLWKYRIKQAIAVLEEVTYGHVMVGVVGSGVKYSINGKLTKDDFYPVTESTADSKPE